MRWLSAIILSLLVHILIIFAYSFFSYDSPNVEDRTITGIKFLEDQTADYRKLSSPLGLEPTRKEYLDFIDKIVEKLGIKYTDIARKLKTLEKITLK